jgi:hypothetical protein
MAADLATMSNSKTAVGTVGERWSGSEALGGEAGSEALCGSVVESIWSLKRLFFDTGH